MMERTFRHWYKACKHAYRSSYRRWVRARIWDSVWYQNYRSWRIGFRTWRTRQGWHRSMMRWRYRLFERAYLRFRRVSLPGTSQWLIDTEVRYGGKIFGVTTKNSPLDPTGSETLVSGGDRMLHHGYASHYAGFLEPYVKNRGDRIVICEVGVLEGTGLAVWCDLFPNARIIGLDIDLSNIRRNMDNLRGLGALGVDQPICGSR